MERRIILFLWFMVFTACSLSQFGWKTSARGQKAPTHSRTLVEDWDPLTLKEEPVSYPWAAPPAAEPASPGSPISVPDRGLSLDTEKEGQVPGYRVQLLSTSNETAAWEEKKKAMLRFNEKVYLIFDAQYKIRVGDCLTREEAKALRELAVKKGYADAFIVRSQVNRPPAE